MIIMKKVNALLMFLLLTCSAALYPCIGWFNIHEYAKEVAIIKDYMVKWAGINQDANKLISWLEKRIAYTDISPDCLIGIVQILSDQDLGDNKKISKLKRMMQHDKMTRIKDELTLLKEDATKMNQELADTRNELFIAQEGLSMERARIQLESNKIIDARNVQATQEAYKKSQKEEERIAEQEWKKHYLRRAKQVFAECMAMIGAVCIGMPIAMAGTRYADDLVKFYTDQWKKN